MKQLLIIVVMGLLPIVASAQKGLAIERVMKNISEYSSHNDQVHMEGNSVSAYGLSLFESLVAHQSAKAVDVMREAALADGQQAVDYKTIVRDGVTNAGYYQLPPIEDGEPNRFVFFRVMDSNSAMLIYMEGETTLDKIVNIKLNKK